MPALFRLLLFCTTLTVLLPAQEALIPEWTLVRSSPVNGGEGEAWGIDTDNAGNVFWAPNLTQPGIFQGMDALLYKLDTDSNEIWANPAVYADLHAQQTYIVTLTDDVVYLGGRDCFEFTLDPNLPFCDMFILAVDPLTGDTLWSTTWDQGFGYEEVDGLVVEDDGIYVTGWTRGDSTGMDIAILKMDLDGNVLWSNTWGTEMREHQDGHIVIDDSIIYVAGLYGGSEIGGSCLLPDLDGQALLAKFSKTDGSYISHTTFGRDDSWCNFENALGMASDGEYLYLTGITTVANNDNNIFIAKYDKNLRQIWLRNWGGPATETARAIAVGDNGNIYIGGNTDSFGAGGVDVIVLKYSPDGDLLNAKTWGGSNEDQSLDIEIQGDLMYLTGKGKSFNNNNDYDAYLLKIDLASQLTAIDERQFEPGTFLLEQNYPNPFNPTTHIGFRIPPGGRSDFGFVDLKIFDIQGRLVKTLINENRQIGEYSVTWNGTDDNGKQVSSGIYIYRLKSGDFYEAKRMLLLR